MSEELSVYGEPEITRKPAVESEIRTTIQEISKHYAMIPDDLVRSGKLGPIAVYAGLDRIARGDKTQTEVAISFLATYCELSTTTVQKALTWLGESHFIEVVRVGPGRQSNRYILPFRKSRLSEYDNQISTKIGRICQQSNRTQESAQEAPSVPSDFSAKSSVTPGGTSPEVGVHVSINPSVKQTQPVEVDENFRERMRVKYNGILSDLDDRIDECLAHPTTQKHKNKQLTVQRWLRIDSEKSKLGTNSAPRAGPPTTPPRKESEIPYAYTQEGQQKRREWLKAWSKEGDERAARNVAAGRRAGENE